MSFHASALKSPTSSAPTAVQETEAEQLEQQLHVPELRVRDAGNGRWRVWPSTLAFSAVFSGSRRAGLRARPEFRAQPESSRTQPPLRLLACTVSCQHWSLQKMVGQLLWMAQIEHKWVNTQHHKKITCGRTDRWAYQGRYQWRRPPKAHWWQGR